MAESQSITRIKVTPFEEAVAMHRQLAESQLTFTIKAHSGSTAADLIPPSQRDGYCPKCHFPHGTPGWVRMDWPVGHPLFGQAIPCPKCNRGGGR